MLGCSTRTALGGVGKEADERLDRYIRYSAKCEKAASEEPLLRAKFDNESLEDDLAGIAGIDAARSYLSGATSRIRVIRIRVVAQMKKRAWWQRWLS
jgi:hypothetical protein